MESAVLEEGVRGEVAEKRGKDWNKGPRAKIVTKGRRKQAKGMTKGKRLK